MDAAAARAESAGDRLGCPAQCGAAWERPEVRRLSLRINSEACGTCRLGTAAELEGLARLPHAEPTGECAAESVPRGQLRLQRNGPSGNAAAKAARRTRAQRYEQRTAGRGRQSLYRQ